MTRRRSRFPVIEYTTNARIKSGKRRMIVGKIGGQGFQCDFVLYSDALFEPLCAVGDKMTNDDIENLKKCMCRRAEHVKCMPTAVESSCKLVTILLK